MKAEHPMTIVTEIAEAMQVVLTERADELARQTGFVKRQRKLKGSQFVQALVFGWMADSEARLETLSQSAANVSVQISRQGLHQRFTPEAAAFLQAVLYECIEQVIKSQPVDTSVLSRFEGVYVMDSTVLVLPDVLSGIWEGCSGSVLKLSVCWELLSGQLVRVQLHDGIEHDQRSPVQGMSLPHNAIRLADLGYFKLDVLDDYDQAGVCWVTRYKVGTTLLNTAGQQLDLLTRLSQQEDDIIDLSVQLGATHQIGCRLIAQRIPPDKLKQRQQQLRRWESRKQTKASPLKWTLLAWSIYLTNASIAQLAASEVMLMARVRWQIELLFKLWKQVIDIDDWRSQHPWRILCEVYAKLIACIIQHWLMLVGGLHDLTVSMHQAAPAIQNWAWALAFALSDQPTLTRCIAHLGNILASTCRICTSTSSLPTFQRFRLHFP
jgi:hypothetical protein